MAHNKPELRSFHLFAGAGGGILADLLLGHRTVGACEIEEYPRNVLLQRQRDGILPMFPVWDDVRTLDGKPWRGKVDIVAGGFPCQDISAAGKGAGIGGERSGLWREMARVIAEMCPGIVFIENSPLLVSRGLAVVLCDLAEMGYDAVWGVVGAHHVGATHKRDRIWILAYSMYAREWRNERQEEIEGDVMVDSGRAGLQGCEQSGSLRGEWIWPDTYGPISKCCGFSTSTRWWDFDPADLPDSNSGQQQGRRIERRQWNPCEAEEGWKREFDQRPVESRLGRVAHGVANRVDRLKAIGNGQVPAVAATAFRILSQGLV